MLPRTANPFVFLGVLHLELQSMPANRLLRHPDGGALDRLEWYLDRLTELGFGITATAAWPLQNLRDQLVALAPDSGLTEADAEKLRGTTLMLRETLYAEASNRTLYEVTGKRFDTKALLSDLPSLMRAGTYFELPKLAAIDLHEAALCIAFDRPTAAAFHTLRSTEGVLRHYYSCVVRSKRIRKPWLWKSMLDDMSAPKRRRRPPSVLVGHLDTIREHFRNPTQHPDKIYDTEEAQDLFAQCLAVIERMVSDQHWETPEDSVGNVLAAAASSSA